MTAIYKSYYSSENNLSSCSIYSPRGINIFKGARKYFWPFGNARVFVTQNQEKFAALSTSCSNFSQS